MANPAIRLATEADIAGLQEAAELAYTKYLPRLQRRPKPMDADFTGHVKRREAWIAEDGEQFVGYVILIPQSESMLVDNVAVLPVHQGKGIGIGLLHHAEYEAQRLALPKMTLYTNVKMTENQELYARFGYRETGRSEVNGVHRVDMEKQLDREDD